MPRGNHGRHRQTLPHPALLVIREQRPNRDDSRQAARSERWDAGLEVCVHSRLPCCDGSLRVRIPLAVALDLASRSLAAHQAAVRLKTEWRVAVWTCPGSVDTLSS